MKKLLLLILLSASNVSAQNPGEKFGDLIQPSVFALTRVMMHDVVNPPAASRFYSYCMIAASSAISGSDTMALPLMNVLKDYKPAPDDIGTNTSNPQITALFSILETGRQMLPSGFMIEKDQEELIAKLKKRKVSAKEINESITAARLIAKKIIGYASGDAYGKLSAKLRYTPKKGNGYWYPTPPAYMEAVEPNWKTVRTLIIDSCNQFIPARPVSYSEDSTSDFYKLAKEVYDVSNNKTAEQLHIAAFWDCNPFAIETAGHLSLGFKKISPGGHWMNIAGIAATKAGLSFNETIILQTAVSITLMDAFISCWDEKYRSHRIRPETFINKRIDVKWQPLLQTPPFPEYPSGHSVISSAAAEVLSYFLGDSFWYTDDTELMFEIPARKFSSFRHAASEAAISRLYGGIHFRDAIEQGLLEGRNVGMYIVGKLKKAGMVSYSPVIR